VIKQAYPSNARRLIFCPGVIFVALLFAASSRHAFSQLTPNSDAVSRPSVSFTLDFPNSEPAHYAINVDASGHASYDCTVKMEGADDQTYKTEFNLTPATRQHIFDLAKQAKYFTGKIDSENRKLAFTGDKALSYQDGQHSNTAHYNYSNLEPVRELTTLFQSMAATLDYGRRLIYDHRYQKLALDDEIKRMEAQAKSNELSEIQGVAPILQEIADDSSVINSVRARARELIQMGAAGH
jgi:hypothetical protein